MNTSNASQPSGRQQIKDDQVQKMLSRFFGQMDHEAFEDVEAAIIWVEVPAKAYLVKQGAKGDSMYILIKGQLEAVFRDDIGQGKKDREHPTR